jgi:dipeptidyl aminopeptidase/acylaminoacyl peptidase
MINALRRSGISDVYVHRDARTLRPTQALDGTIAYCVEEMNPQDQKQRFTIWTLGGPNQFPTQIQTGSQPAISPDGRHIAYIGPDGNLWVVNVDGSQATQLTAGADKILERFKESLSAEEGQRYDAFVKEFGFAEKMPYSFPSWSKDGQHIAFTAMDGSDSTGRPNEDIWLMNVDGSSKRQLTTNGSIDRYPLLSPDGKWVYFMSNRGGHWAIWRIPAEEAGAATNGN